MKWASWEYLKSRLNATMSLFRDHDNIQASDTHSYTKIFLYTEQNRTIHFHPGGLLYRWSPTRSPPIAGEPQVGVPRPKVMYI